MAKRRPSRKRPVQLINQQVGGTAPEPTAEQILDFLESFRDLQLTQAAGNSVLISLRVPEKLLNAFRAQSQFDGVKYQTQIKNLMFQYLSKNRRAG